MLYNYSRNINKYDKFQVSKLLCNLFDEGKDIALPYLINWYKFCDNYYVGEKSLKKLKDLLEKEKLSYFGSERKLENLLLVEVYNRLTGCQNDKDNLMMCLFRSWEWPYYSDQEMNTFNGSIETLIDRGEINLFNRDKCAYRDELKDNIFEDLRYQERNIQNYLDKENLPRIDIEGLINCIRILDRWINDPSLMHYSGMELSSSFENAVKQWHNIRMDSLNVRTVVKESLSNGMIVDSIMTKTSGSLWNQHQGLKGALKDAYQVNKITNVIGNFFYGDDCILPKSYLRDMKNIKGFTSNFFTLVCGKGDGYKVRYVGQPATVYQNFLEPLADNLQKHMRVRNSKGNPNISTFDQEGIYKERIRKAEDAFGIDFSGYSDFLSRNLIFHMCENIYQWDKEICKYIRDIFSFPVKVNGKFFRMIWGSLQGSKLNFHVITDANQYMWALSCVYSGYFDEANFAGDDRIEVNYKERYPESFMDYQLAISIAFNCVTNKEKTESWNKDGVVSFCKISFNNKREPVSGLSANILMKHKPFINEINAIFKQMKKTGYLYINDNWSNKVNRLINQYYEDLKVMSTKFKTDLDFKISVAKSVPLDWGGLNPDDEAEQPILYLNMIRGMVTEYQNNPNMAGINSNGWNWLLEVTDSGKLFLETEYGKYLITNEFKVPKVVALLKKIDKIERDFREFNRIDLELLKEIKGEFRQIIREAEYRTNTNNASTKNRTDIRSDEDKLYSTFLKYKDIDQPLSVLGPNNIINLCLLNNVGKQNSLDPFIRFLKYQHDKPNWFEEGLVSYTGFAQKPYLGYIPLQYRNYRKKCIVRLETKTDTWYRGYDYDFVPSSCLNEEERNILEVFSLIADTELDNIALKKYEYDKIMKKIKGDITAELKEEVRKNLKDAIQKCMV